LDTDETQTDERSGDGPGQQGSSPGRRLGLILGIVASAVILVAAGFGLAQLVDQDTVSTASRAAELPPENDEAASGPPAAAPGDAAPEALEPALPPLLESLPLDRDELEQLFDEFRERLGDDFELPFDDLPLPEDVPGLDALPELDLPGLDELLPGLEDLPLDLDELERLFDEFEQSLPEGFEFRGELPELDAIPGLDELPFEGPELERWLEDLRERFGERFAPDRDSGSDERSENSELEA
jgi:hypothetical protein